MITDRLSELAIYFIVAPEGLYGYVSGGARCSCGDVADRAVLADAAIVFIDTAAGLLPVRVSTRW